MALKATNPTSKNRITKETLKLLIELANEVDLKDAISKYFKGDIINATEGRAVLHTALRAPKDAKVLVDGENVIPEVHNVKRKIENFTNSVVSGNHKGFTGKAITDIVNIGIGGSDLGPAMVVDSLQFYKNHLNTHFVSNVDGDHHQEIIKKLNPETTLFVIVSKTFTTQETLSKYNNFFDSESEAIIPYTQYLNQFATYLQQGIMESNGKSVDRDGNKVNYETGTLIWGEPGTNSQHAFFQLIHQGTKLIPADFIGFVESLYGNKEHHDKLMSNYFAQTEALMNGKTDAEVINEFKGQSLSQEEINKLTPFKVFEGNKPTTSLLIQKLTPESLGFTLIKNQLT